MSDIADPSLNPLPSPADFASRHRGLPPRQHARWRLVLSGREPLLSQPRNESSGQEALAQLQACLEQGALAA